jgi:hypothetical protein
MWNNGEFAIQEIHGNLETPGHRAAESVSVNDLIASNSWIFGYYLLEV